MHALDLAVHPYTDQDDHLHYRDIVYDEASLYVNKGVDGLFVEFPHSQLVILEHLGSKANFPNFPSTSSSATPMFMNVLAAACLIVLALFLTVKLIKFLFLDQASGRV